MGGSGIVQYHHRGFILDLAVSEARWSWWRGGIHSCFKYAVCMWWTWGWDTGATGHRCFLAEWLAFWLQFKHFGVCRSTKAGTLSITVICLTMFVKPRVCLLRLKFWGEEPDLQKSLDAAYLHFRDWQKRNKIRATQPPFKTWMVIWCANRKYVLCNVRL